jgi:hypothetical protein
MAHGRSDEEIVRTTHNTARFFTETRHVAWVLLIGTMLWGVYGYLQMLSGRTPTFQSARHWRFVRGPVRAQKKSSSS